MSVHLGGLGSAIKSIQTGTFSYTAAPPSTITIPTAVNPAKAFVIFQNGGAYNAGGISGYVSGANTITVIGTWNSGTLQGTWQVIEFE